MLCGTQWYIMHNGVVFHIIGETTIREVRRYIARYAEDIAREASQNKIVYERGAPQDCVLFIADDVQPFLRAVE